MPSLPFARRTAARSTARSTALCLAAGVLATVAGAQTPMPVTKSVPTAAQQGPDPRIGLGAGWMDAKQAIRNLELVAHRPRPAGWFNPAQMGDFGFANADLAFSGDHAFQGGFNGVQIWDISTPSNPTLRGQLVCPGGQGDVSVYRNLLFMSVEETRGRVDCGTQGVTDTVSADLFRGVRVFDISDVSAPRQVASVQTCRGSHTHTLLVDPKDSANVYVYVAGTSPVRPASELAGCSGRSPQEDPNTSLFRIEVIRVPLAAPQTASIVSTPRVFADSTGNVAGLWAGGTHGAGTQETAQTDQCHDITVYPEIGLAAGACSGNGILLDISDPANPKRIDEVSDPNFAYWHSATFSNDGSKILFTDEWGGGVAPRCQASDKPEWGANAIFTVANRELKPAGYYKLPAAQTATENCVAHNGTLIPIPGRDVMVQAWYQGGISVFDFTNPAKPVEIAFFDRGPMDAANLTLGGYWSAYWYNGHILGSEIGRGLDVFRLTPSEHLSQNEIDAALLVKTDLLNPQLQTRVTWPASFVVARAYLDQLARNGGLAAARRTAVARALDGAERQQGAARRTALTQLATQLDRDAQGAGDAAKVRMLAGAVRDLAR
ncbi:MAG: LVIVD repeat-containing protein [Gemmatirosa sp.]